MNPETAQVLQEVYVERSEQDAEWGEQNHTPLLWLAILAEEFGEVAKEVNEITFRDKTHYHYRAELIQVAAVAVAAIESLDRARNG